MDAVASGLLDLVREQCDLGLAAERLVDPLAEVCPAEMRTLQVGEDDPAVRSGKRLVGVVEELDAGRMRLLDQRQHRVVVEREHDDPADLLPDPGVDLVDLRVELVVRVALEQLIAALARFALGPVQE